MVVDDKPTAQTSVGDTPETAVSELSPAPTFGLETALNVDVQLGALLVVAGGVVGIRG
jgi:hypothetical protein